MNQQVLSMKKASNVDTIDMCKFKTIIIVTHRKDMLEKCDKIFKVDEGKICEVTYDEITENL